MRQIILMEELKQTTTRVLDNYNSVTTKYSSLLNILKYLMIGGFMLSGVLSVFQPRSMSYLLPAVYLYNISLFFGLIIVFFQTSVIIITYVSIMFSLAILYYINGFGMIIMLLMNSLVSYESYWCYPVEINILDIFLSFPNAVMISLITYFGMKLHSKLKEKEMIEQLLMEYSNIIEEQNLQKD